LHFRFFTYLNEPFLILLQSEFIFFTFSLIHLSLTDIGMNGAGPLTAASTTTTTAAATTTTKEVEANNAKESSPSISQQTSIEVTNEFLSTSKSKENITNLENQTKRISSALQFDVNREPELTTGDDVMNIHNNDDDDREPLVGIDDNCQSPNLVPITKRETVSSSVYVAMSSSPCPRSPYTEEEEDEEEEENLSLTSPGTPCSQCLRDEEELATSQRHRSMVPSSAVGGKMKFCNGEHADMEQQSSEECYSVESGSLCCNSSCCDERHLVSKKSAESSSRGKRLSSEEAVAKLGQKSVTTGCDGGESCDVSSRQLLTYVTPGMETVPLEMCQDIPDVLI